MLEFIVIIVIIYAFFIGYNYEKVKPQWPVLDPRVTKKMCDESREACRVSRDKILRR